MKNLVKSIPYFWNMNEIFNQLNCLGLGIVKKIHDL